MLTKVATILRCRTAFDAAPLLLLGVSLAGVALSGCTTMMTTAAIHQFQNHLETSDAEGIATLTTERFRDVALPDDSALSTFDLLGVPIGEVTIDEVNETSATTRDVLVSIAGSSRKLTYHFERSTDSFGRSKWLVDDITIRQGTGPKAVEKAVTDQMQLLLGVRDAVRAWQGGRPEEVLAYSGGRLGDRLEALPPNWRSQLARRYFGEVLKSKPRAKLVDGEAEVQLSHKEGQLRLILEENDQTGDDQPTWVVKTAVIVGGGKKITHELRRELDLLLGVTSFVKAYNTNDQEQLERICQRDFFANVLSVSDLRQQPLPPDTIFASDYEVRFGNVSNEVTVTLDGVVTQFSALTKEDGRQIEMKMDEVTFLRDGEAVRLSAQLLVMPTVALFNESVNTGDVARLRYLTSDHWNQPVWDRFREDRRNILDSIALPPFDPQPSNPEAQPIVRYNGAQVEVRQVMDDALVSYKLSTSAHRLVVDDVELVDFHGLLRMRSRLASLCTLDQMADGIVMGNPTPVAEASTPALNRIAWSLTAAEELPAHLDLIPYLKARVHSIESDDAEMVVTVAHDGPVARFLMSSDGTMIDDVVFIDAAGTEQGRFSQLVRQHRVDSSR